MDELIKEFIAASGYTKEELVNLFGQEPSIVGEGIEFNVEMMFFANELRAMADVLDKVKLLRTLTK